MVVGARGEKRFVKSVPREQLAQRDRTVLRGKGTRGTKRGGVGGRISGATSVPIRGKPIQAPVITETEWEMEAEAELDPGTKKEMESKAET
jgi:hypothetical protein